MIQSAVQSVGEYCISVIGAGEGFSALMSSPIVALAFIFAVGAFGLYMLLPGQQQFSASAVRWFGGPLMLISLALLAALVGVRVPWWPQIPENEQVSVVAFAIPGIAALGSAVMAVTSRSMTRGVLWFAATVAAVSVLLLLHGSILSALANALLAVGALAAWRMSVAPSARVISQTEDDARLPGGEPFLACLTGGLLCVVLVGLISQATGGSSIREDDRLGRTITRKREALVDSRMQASTAKPDAASLGALRGLVRAGFRERPLTMLAMAAVVLAALASAVGIALRQANGLPTFSTDVGDAGPSEMSSRIESAN